MEHPSEHPSNTPEVLQALQFVLRLDPVLSVSTLAALFYIAAHPDCAAADLVRDLGMAQAAVTRHLQRLGDGSPGGSAAVGKGLGWVQWYSDPKDTRRRLYQLSALGRNVVNTVADFAMPPGSVGA